MDIKDSSISEIAKKELNETAQSVQDGILKLQSSDQMAQLPRQDPEFLLRFLRASKFDSDVALDRIKGYNKARSSLFKVYPNMKPSFVLPLLNMGVFTIVEVNDGPATLFLEFKNWNTNDCDMHMLFQALYMILEKLLEDPRTQVCGVQFVADITHLSFQKVKHILLYPSVNFRVAQCFRSSLPLRLKGIFYCNAPSIFVPVFNLIRIFLGAKLRERVFMFNDSASLQEHLELRQIPVSLGGTAEVSCDAFVKEFVNWESVWTEMYRKEN